MTTHQFRGIEQDVNRVLALLLQGLRLCDGPDGEASLKLGGEPLTTMDRLDDVSFRGTAAILVVFVFVHCSVDDDRSIDASWARQETGGHMVH